MGLSAKDGVLFRMSASLSTVGGFLAQFPLKKLGRHFVFSFLRLIKIAAKLLSSLRKKQFMRTFRKHIIP
jgi:hypothetical protein